MIQEAAAKCRFCGEWIDPSKRPEWSLDQTSVAQRLPTPPQAPVPSPAMPDPSRPSLPDDGFGDVPRLASPRPSLASTQESFPPPDSAPSEPGLSGQPMSGMSGMSGGGIASGGIGEGLGPWTDDGLLSGPEPAPVLPDSESAFGEPPPNPTDESGEHHQEWTAPAWMAPPGPARRPVPSPADSGIGGPGSSFAEPPPEPEEHASLDEVALRMQRIRASAAAVRDAVQREADAFEGRGPATPARAVRPTPAPGFEDEPVAARAAAPEPDEYEYEREPVRAPAPTSPRAPAAAGTAGFEDAFLGDDLDEDYDDDFEDSDGFGDLTAAPKPVPWLPIASGVLLLAVAGIIWQWEAIVGSEEAVEVAEAEPTQEPDQAPAETEQAPPDPQAGKPVTPAEVAGVPEEQAEPEVEGPAELSPELKKTLEEARKLYPAAGGSPGQLDDARKLLDAILAEHPKHPEALMLTAQIQLEQGKMKESAQTAQRCVEAAPETADCWLVLGVLHQDGDAKNKAVEAYEKYLALAPDGTYAGDVRKQLERLK